MPKATPTGDGAGVSRRRRSAAAESKRKPKTERGVMMRVLLHSPKDTVAVTLAGAAVVAIVVNALFLQAGRHPSPMFGATIMLPLAAASVATTPMLANPLPRPRPSEASIAHDETSAADTGPAETKSIDPASRPTKALVAPRANAAKQVASHSSTAHSDPLGDLITSSRRTMGVQRALTKYGYGQLKATGTLGPDTQAAIQKFERERKLPVTGQISDRLVRELSAVTGQAID